MNVHFPATPAGQPVRTFGSEAFRKLNPSLGGKAVKPTMRQDRKGMNKTEAAFSVHLYNTTGQAPLREGLTLPLGNGVRYTPDFVVITDATNGHEAPVCEVRCYEVKGFMRDDAAVKIKVAARLFRFFSFFLVHQLPKGGGWNIEQVFP